MIPTRDLLALRVRSLWRFFLGEGFVYWATCCYLIVEYVRPQQLLSPIYGAPLGQIVLGAALVAHVGSGRWFSMKGVGSWLLLLYTAVIVVSSITAYEPSVAIDNWREWFSWVVIYFLLINVVNTEQRFVVFILVWLMCHYYMGQGGAKQFAFRGFRFANWGVTGAPGWFFNSGEFAIAMCMFTVVSWHFFMAARSSLTTWRKVFVLGMPITAILSIIGSSSRGAFLGLASVGIWGVMRGKHPVRTGLGLAVLAAAVWITVPPQFKERFITVGEDQTSEQRLVYWKAGREMANQHPVLGIGFSNWERYYADHYADPTAGAYSLEGRVQVSHNIFIQCIAELGYTGLVVFVLLILATLRINYQTRRCARAGPAPPNDFVILMAYALDGALISYLVCGFFVTVLYYPFFWINLALTVALGGIARHKYRVVVPAARSAALSSAFRGTQPVRKR